MLFAIFILVSTNCAPKPSPKNVTTTKYALTTSCDNYLKVYDTHGYVDESTWSTVASLSYVFASPRHIVLESNLSRVTYETLTTGQNGAHSVYIKSGVAWVPVTGPYGDYTYWVSSVATEPINVVLLDIGPEKVSARWTWAHTTGTLQKTVAIYPDIPGAFYLYHSDPINPPGEREIGLGGTFAVVFSPIALGLHPIAGQHVNLQIAQEQPPYWAAAFQVGTPVLKILSLSRPIETMSYQFSADQGGYPTVHWLDEQSVIPEQYQAFIGGVIYPATKIVWEYDEDRNVSPLEVLSDTSASGQLYVKLTPSTIVSRPLTFSVPQDGTYTVWMRYRATNNLQIETHVDTRVQSYFVSAAATWVSTTIFDNEYFDAGNHIFDITNVTNSLDVDLIAITPNSGNPNSPKKIATQVRTIMGL